MKNPSNIGVKGKSQEADSGELDVSKLITDRLSKRQNSYFEKRLKSIEVALKLLQEVGEDTYEYYKENIEKAQKEGFHTASTDEKFMEKLEKFDEAIDDIQEMRPVAERVIINRSLSDIISELREVFRGEKDTLVIFDDFIPEKEDLISACILREAALPHDDKNYIVTTNWPVNRNTLRSKYGELLKESEYRMGTIKLLKASCQQKTSQLENPFINFKGNEKQYIKWLMDDYQALVAHVDRLIDLGELFSASSAAHYTLMGLKEALESSHVFQQMKSIAESTAESEIVSSDQFFEVARRICDINTVLFQWRGTSDPAKEDENSEKTVMNNLEALWQRGDNTSCYYQLAIAKKMGIITEKNLVERVPYKKATPRSVMAMMDQAKEDGENLAVLVTPSGECLVKTEIESVRYQPVPLNIFEAPQITNPISEGYDFISKVPYRDLFYYKQGLLSKHMSAGSMMVNLGYMYNKETGLYSIYGKHDYIRKYGKDENATRTAIESMVDRYESDDYSKYVYPYMVFSNSQNDLVPNTNMIPILKKLKEANIDFHILPCDSDSSTLVYYPPECSEKVLELVGPYGKDFFYATVNGKYTEIDTRTTEGIKNYFFSAIEVDEKEDKIPEQVDRDEY